jgi:hypothetical protein
MSPANDPRRFGGAGVAPGYDGPCEECGRPGQSIFDPHGRPVMLILCEDCEASYTGGFAAPKQWLLVMLALVGLAIAAWFKFK